MLRILSVGDDPDLLSTRAELLRLTGAEVVKCRGRDAAKTLETESFDLVVLCHTLSEQEARDVVGVVERRGGITKILQTTPFGTVSGSTFRVKVDDVVSAVPELLVQRAARLLGLQAQSSRKQAQDPVCFSKNGN